MKKNKDNSYWIKRKAQMMYENMETAEKAADETAFLYMRASDYVERKLAAVFNRCKNNVRINKSDVLSIIESAASGNIEDIIRTAKARGIKELTDYLEQSDIKRRYRKLTELEKQIDGLINNLYKNEKAAVNKALEKISGDSYYRSVFEIQKQTGLGFSFNKFDKKLLDRIVNSKWSGTNYSKRIWKRTQELADTLKSEMLQGFMCGKTYKEITKVVTDNFSASAFNARRLVRTEGCFVSNECQRQSYEECGVERYIFVATLDLRTSEVCAGLDGKVFRTDEAVPGKNMPPMHPWCRSTTIAYVDDETLAGMKRRARNPATGKNEIVPANMTYDEWYAKYGPDNKAKDSSGPVDGSNKSDKKEKIKNMASTGKKTWPEKGKKISGDEYKEVMKYARERNIELSGFKQFDGDILTVKELIDDAESAASLYPEIKEGKKKLTIMLDEYMNSEDFAVTRGHVISINADAYRDTKRLAEEYDRLVREKWFVSGTDYHSIIKHEMGHVVANRYNIDGLEIAERITGKTGAELITYLRNELSEYSASYPDGREIIAECFSSVFSGADNEFALKFVNECAKMK